MPKMPYKNKVDLKTKNIGFRLDESDYEYVKARARQEGTQIDFFKHLLKLDKEHNRKWII